MKFTSSALLSAALASQGALAHYTFSDMLVNGSPVGRPFEYIREHTRGYMPTHPDGIMSNDFRCQPGAATGGKTKVLTVKAGDKIGMKQAFGATGIQHPGPAQMWMSKAPGDVKDYDGSGDWFKVREDLLCHVNQPKDLLYDAWCVYNKDNIEFEMPALPAGQYLVRAEHIALHGAHGKNGAEFYYSCAQVEIKEGSGSLPTETVKIPGVYKPDDKFINFNLWGNAVAYPFKDMGAPLIPGGQLFGSEDGKTDKVVKIAGGNTAAASTPATPATNNAVAAPATTPAGTGVAADGTLMECKTKAHGARRARAVINKD